jgi:hypothetical protein
MIASPKTRHCGSGTGPRYAARSFRLMRRYGRSSLPARGERRSTLCGHDYESFTDSWLPADMNSGGRTPRLWACCADHDHGTTTKMIETGVCTL